MKKGLRKLLLIYNFWEGIMDKSTVDYTLYLVTDRDVLKGKDLEKAVEEAILGGTTLIQIREKNESSLEFYNIALGVKKITDKYNVPLIINDRIDIALAVDAAGVHIGQSDLNCAVVRRILPKDKIVGVSAHTLQESIQAERDGADYIGCGAMFSTSTKKDATSVRFDTLKEIKTKINIPVVAIGGIGKNNISEFKGIGIDGIAVVSAILGNEDIKSSTKELKEKFENLE